MHLLLSYTSCSINFFLLHACESVCNVLHACTFMLIQLHFENFICGMFISSRLGDSHSALKDKYETAEQAMQKKWHKYCARGEFLLTLLHIFFLRFSCWPYFQHRWIAQTPVLWLDLLWLFLSLEVSREIFVDCWKVFPSHSQCPYEFVRITHFSVLICFCAGGLLSAYSSFRYFGTSASEMGSELNLMSLCRL